MLGLGMGLWIEVAEDCVSDLVGVVVTEEDDERDSVLTSSLS